MFSGQQAVGLGAGVNMAASGETMTSIRGMEGQSQSCDPGQVSMASAGHCLGAYFRWASQVVLLQLSHFTCV